MLPIHIQTCGHRCIVARDCWRQHAAVRSVNFQTPSGAMAEQSLSESEEEEWPPQCGNVTWLCYGGMCVCLWGMTKAGPPFFCFNVASITGSQKETDERDARPWCGNNENNEFPAGIVPANASSESGQQIAASQLTELSQTLPPAGGFVQINTIVESLYDIMMHRFHLLRPSKTTVWSPDVWKTPLTLILKVQSLPSCYSDYSLFLSFVLTFGF